MRRRKSAGRIIVDVLLKYAVALLVAALGGLIIYYVINTAFAEMIKNVSP